ncbi:hypothetical protein HMPREF0970_01467 [Schaalia odontolytica F0309]|uniref:Uncharacterized protein n=1 Tax=Schaalia odontolytica F0309 TaxID=649742 RepID=D4TZT1_9ACTO|nr:hypothetical protein HMPREF0970_01467 [Schaalia odontolytica F0309]
MRALSPWAHGRPSMCAPRCTNRAQFDGPKRLIPSRNVAISTMRFRCLKSCRRKCVRDCQGPRTRC